VSREFLVNPESLASVAEFVRDMLGCPNLRSFLRPASTTANLMDVDPGIDENTFPPSFRVSERRYNTSQVAALHGPVTKLPRGQPGGRQVGEPGGVVRVGVAAPYVPDMGRVRQNWL